MSGPPTQPSLIVNQVAFSGARVSPVRLAAHENTTFGKPATGAPYSGNDVLSSYR